nr:CPBP family intramembrane glutamic endopeptidase [Spirulina subsalsa]
MNHTQKPDIEPLTRTQVLVAMGVTALVLLVVSRVWQYLGNVSLMPIRFNGQSLAVGVGIALGISLLSSLIYRFWEPYRRSANFYLQLVLKPLVWPDLIWLGLLPGLSEELLFRGVMLPAFGGAWLALIISSLLFGILHMSTLQQWPYMIWATVIGCVLGYSAIATQNLLVPIVAHIITNFLSGFLWKFTHSGGMGNRQS